MSRVDPYHYLFRVIALFFVFFSGSGAIGSVPNNAPVPNGKEFISPDARYSIHVAELDGEARFVIKDNKTGIVDDTIPMPTVLLYLQWSEYSKFIITVEHIARGSYVTILYLQNEKWKAADFGPSSSGVTDSSVVDLKIQPGEVEIQYAVVDESKSGRPIGYRLCNCSVSLKTMERSCKWTAISPDRYQDLMAHSY